MWRRWSACPWLAANIADLANAIGQAAAARRDDVAPIWSASSEACPSALGATWTSSGRISERPRGHQRNGAGWTLTRSPESRSACRAREASDGSDGSPEKRPRIRRKTDILKHSQKSGPEYTVEEKKLTATTGQSTSPLGAGEPDILAQLGGGPWARSQGSQDPGRPHYPGAHRSHTGAPRFLGPVPSQPDPAAAAPVAQSSQRSSEGGNAEGRPDRAVLGGPPGLEGDDEV